MKPLKKNYAGSMESHVRTLSNIGPDFIIRTSRLYFELESGAQKRVPQIVPQLDANQALHARYAAHARWFFLSGFVSRANKGAMNKS